MAETDTIDRAKTRKVQVASLPPADSGRGFARLPDGAAQLYSAVIARNVEAVISSHLRPSSPLSVCRTTSAMNSPCGTLARRSRPAGISRTRRRAAPRTPPARATSRVERWPRRE